MTALEKFEEAMMVLGNEYLSPFVQEKLETGEIKGNPDHTVYRKIFYGYSEILNARDALKLSQSLISVAPPRSVKVNKDEYLIYNINSFLNDIYILKERLNTYATWIKRLYRNNLKKKKIEESIDPLFEFIPRSHAPAWECIQDLNKWEDLAIK